MKALALAARNFQMVTFSAGLQASRPDTARTVRHGGSKPDSDLVVELHLMPTGKPEHIQPSMALYFTEERPSKLPYMIRLGRQDIDIPAGEREYTSTDSYVLPVDVEAVAIQPHAHRLAKDIRGMATLPDGTSQWLIDIKDWDMRWQDV